MDRPNRQSVAGSAALVWNSTFTRFRDWVKADVWKRLFDAVPDDLDIEYAMVDASIVKVHRHGCHDQGQDQ